MQYSIYRQQQQHHIKVADHFYCAAQWQALADTKARICSLCMNELTVMHAYDEFGDDGDEVKRCKVICDGVRKHSFLVHEQIDSHACLW